MRTQISPSLMCMNLMEIKQQLSVLNTRADKPELAFTSNQAYS